MYTRNLYPDLQKTKHQFETLDGLRGIAAIGVVIFHFMEIAYPDFNNNFIAHGFLAVDFFFCLSGFVIAYAYDDRMENMGLGEFFRARIIRLHPLVVLGSILGLVAYLFDPFGGHPEVYSAGKILLMFITSMLLIPFPVIEERFFNLFGLNAPSWSLFWEYVANIVYALVLVKLSRVILLCLGVLAAIWITYVAATAGSLLGGWSAGTFWDGGARIAYSFLAGMLIFRYKITIKNNLGFIGMAILLSAAFMMPYSWGWPGELAVVLVYFPLMIALGAGTSTATGLKKTCSFLADISYPLYMTHYSMIWMFFNYYQAEKPGTGMLIIMVMTGLALMLSFAFLAMKAFDIPLRRYLTARFRKQ